MAIYSRLYSKVASHEQAPHHGCDLLESGGQLIESASKHASICQLPLAGKDCKVGQPLVMQQHVQTFNHWHGQFFSHTLYVIRYLQAAVFLPHGFSVLLH